MPLQPQQIARRLFEGTLTTTKALEHFAQVKSEDRHQFIDHLVFTAGLNYYPKPGPGTGGNYYERGVDVLAELFVAQKTTVAPMVNHVHAAFFQDISTGVLRGDRLPEPSRVALRNFYEELQARSPEAALNFLMRGLLVTRNEIIVKAVEDITDRPTIFGAAASAGRIDMLYKKLGWEECVPHLTSKGRDQMFSKDLGL